MNKAPAVSEVVEVIEHLKQLPQLFNADQDFRGCVEALQQQHPVTFDCIWGSSCALLSAALAESFKTLLVVTADGKTQDRLIDDLPTFSDRPIERLPACLTTNDSTISVDQEFGDRLRLV